MKNNLGFTTEDLIKHNVKLKLQLEFEWDNATPEELMKRLKEHANTLTAVAASAIEAYLSGENLNPTFNREVSLSNDELTSDTGWKKISRSN